MKRLPSFAINFSTAEQSRPYSSFRVSPLWKGFLFLSSGNPKWNAPSMPVTPGKKGGKKLCETRPSAASCCCGGREKGNTLSSPPWILDLFLPQGAVKWILMLLACACVVQEVTFGLATQPSQKPDMISATTSLQLVSQRLSHLTYKVAGILKTQSDESCDELCSKAMAWPISPVSSPNLTVVSRH